MPTIPRICIHCGASFVTFPSQVKKGKALYCSIECYWADKPARFEERFWRKIDKTSSPHWCWLWTASKKTPGYGNIQYQGTVQSAHRVMWLLTRGPIPEDMFVCHNCPGGDNPSCVNPAHLWLGTPGDNSRDLVAKGRHISALHPETLSRGERHKSAKLTREIVAAITAEYRAGGISQQTLADRHGVHQTAISALIRGKSWQEVS